MVTPLCLSALERNTCSLKTQVNLKPSTFRRALQSKELRVLCRTHSPLPQHPGREAAHWSMHIWHCKPKDLLCIQLYVLVRIPSQ